MVSTRRTAQVEPADDMANGDTLRKKPVRRATTKKAEVETRAKATRGRKAATTTDDEGLDEHAEEIVPALQAKATRKLASRTKKTTIDQPVENAEPSVAQPAKPTRATRTKKTEVLIDELADQEDVSQPRPTRRTRATEPEPQPLSPKKITQVTKPRTKKTDKKKSNAKAQVANTTARGTRATRARTVSDENAEVPDLSHQAVSEDEIVVISSTPVKRSSAVKASPRKRAESEASMSSRATTPSASPVPSFDKIQDENEYSASKSDQESDVEPEEDAQVLSEHSDDELCGPKTPMKRSSPGATARYRASVRKLVQSSDDQMKVHTPVTQHTLRTGYTRTPTTQLQNNKPSVPVSVERSPIVGRDSVRSFDLHNVQPKNAFVQAGVHASNFDRSETELSDEANDMTEFGHTTTSEPEHEAAVVPDEECCQETVHELQTENLDDPSRGVYDPDETIIVDDEPESDAATQEESMDSFTTEDTVLIAPIEDDVSQDLDHDSQHGSFDRASKSTTPETLVWEYIRQDITIPIDFDSHLMGLTLAPAANTFEVTHDHVENHFSDLSLAADALVVVNASISDDSHDDSLLSNEGLDSNLQEGTINLNDFIDVAGLAEQTQALDIPTQQTECAIEEGEDDTTVLIDHENSDAVVPVSTVPHYALPTACFDARRKSMPALSFHTPHKVGARPTTSDGASAPRMPLVFNRPWAATHITARKSDCHEHGGLPEQVQAPTPSKSRESLFLTRDYASIEEHAKTTAGPKRFQTPLRQIKGQSATAKRSTADMVTPRASTLRPRPRTLEQVAPSTPQVEDESEVSFATENPVPRTPAERYPLLSRNTSVLEHARTVAPAARFQTPLQKSPRRPATVSKISSQAATPLKATARAQQTNATPKTMDRAVVAATPIQDAPAPTPTQGERFSKLPARNDYNEHAKTVSAPRFETPANSPLNRPSTVQKQGSLRKVAVVNSTTMGARTPVKTPLKPPAMTPGQIPMTPHPSAPLQAVVAMVEVYTLEGASASAPFIALLHRLGAKTTKVWNERVTHVVFKDGSPTTLQRVRLHNKGVDESGTGSTIFCVNSRWVTDCDTEGKRVEESDEAYVVDVTEVPRGGQRRRKSMEPSTLINLGGNIVRDRKSSIARSSLSRSPLKFDEPAKQPEKDVTAVSTPVVEAQTLSDKENEEEPSSPATPAYLAAPDKLVQQTAPINRMRKLGSKTREANKLRRLTYFNGAGQA